MDKTVVAEQLFTGECHFVKFNIRISLEWNGSNKNSCFNISIKNKIWPSKEKLLSFSYQCHHKTAISTGLSAWLM